MEELLFAALAAAAMAARLLPLQLSLSLYSLHILTTLYSHNKQTRKHEIEELHTCTNSQKGMRLKNC